MGERTVELKGPGPRLPLALARLHWDLCAGAPVAIDLSWTNGCDRSEARVRDVLTGAGFTVGNMHHEPTSMRIRATRAFTIPDTVCADMRVLVCGLNPSVHAARRGIGYSGPGNRFWPAAVAAGLVPRALDPLSAAAAGVGMTDLCKRPTATAAEVTASEYRDGLARIERLVEWLGAGVVCFVGLDGWRRAVDRKAMPGWQNRGIGGAAAFVMPSTSGRNARSRLEDLVAAMRRVVTSPEIRRGA